LPTGPSISKKGDKPKKQNQIYLFDQMAMRGEQFKRSIRTIKSTKKETQVPVYLIDRTFGLDSVRDRIYKGLFHLPPHLTYNAKENGNFLYHFVTSDRQPDGRWIEAPGAPDHYFHATNFAEMCVLVSLFEPGVRRFTFGSLPIT
jgi:Na+-transporting NADH:ubiquinone oxidoreductase subunit NqrF